jgi:hypothetical protein
MDWSLVIAGVTEATGSVFNYLGVAKQEDIAQIEQETSKFNWLGMTGTQQTQQNTIILVGGIIVAILVLVGVFYMFKKK